MGDVAPLLVPAHRKVALLSGLCAAPLGLGDAVFVPEYWDPPHLFGAAFSIEGVLFSFGNGVLVWLVAVLPYSKRVQSRVDLRQMTGRYLACCGVALVITLLLWRGGVGFLSLPIMTAGLFAMAAIAAFVLIRRPEAWPFALTGAIGFAIVYGFQLFVISLVDPDAHLAWAPTIREGMTVFGFPVEEMVWAFIYGAVWPLAVAYGSDVSFRARGSSDAPLRNA